MAVDPDDITLDIAGVTYLKSEVKGSSLTMQDIEETPLTSLSRYIMPQGLLSHWTASNPCL